MATAANTVEKIQQFSYNTGNNTTVFSTDLRVQGNLTVVGGHVVAQTSTLIVQDNIITLNAFIGQSETPVSSAGIEIDRGNQPNVSLMWIENEGAWKFTSDGITYDVLGGGSAGAYANGAFEKANSAGVYANGAFAKVNAVYQYANSTSLWGMRQSFIATEGQTTFSPGSGYVPGQVDVYYNGIKLYGTEDFTATDGVNVILTNPAGANTIIEVVGFGGNISASNVYVLNSMASLLNRQTFIVPVHGQTVFTPSTPYRAGYVDVYYNGLKMVIPDDVVANNGTHIYFVGLTPTTNDVIEIVGLTPNVALANAIPITGGTVSGGLTLAGNVLPETTNTYYLGSETKRWHSLYVGPGSIDLGGLILSNSGGTLAVSTPGSPATPIAGEDTWVRAQANAAFAAANNVAPQIQPAFDKANSAFNAANNASDSWVRNQANLAFNKANSSAQFGSNTTSNSYFSIPIGTTAERPANPANGSIRYNTTLGRIEGYLYTSGWQNILQESYTVEYLVIAGGGGGGGGIPGSGVGGGGGGGGYRSSVSGESSGGGTSAENTITVTGGTSYSIIIGAGGTGAPGVSLPTSGANSSFGSIISIGGGFGGQPQADATRSTGSGGSGGGLGQNGQTRGQSAGSGTTGQGYPGGGNASTNSGGGGGGAGGPGQSATTGTGGLGVTSSITGVSVSRGGGGGGGRHIDQGGQASGNGGGGNSGTTTSNGSSGTASTGGGGGGAGESGGTYTGGNGGSGVVIIRYLGAQRATGGTVTSVGGYTIHTFTGSGSFIA